jgi:tetratricopeptide (TPR) repeat protein
MMDKRRAVLLRRARGLWGAGLFVKADKILRTLQRTRPDDPEMYYWRGSLALRRGAVTDAVRLLGHAVHLKPDYPDALLELGLAYARVAAWQGARKHWQAAWLAGSPAVLPHLLQLELEQGQESAATDWLRAVRQLPMPLAPAVLRAVELGLGARYQPVAAAAVELLVDLFEQQPDDVEVLRLRGKHLLRCRDYAGAVLSLNHILDLKPRDADAAFWLATALHHMGRFGEAADWLWRSREWRPAHAETHGLLAQILADQGEAEEALHILRTALVHRPDYVAARLMAAQLLQGMGRPSAAEYEAVLSLQPDNFIALHQRGIQYLRDGDPLRAEPLLAAASRLPQDPVSSRCNWGVALRELGRYGEAQQCFEEVLEMVPEHPEALANLAHVRADMGQMDDAKMGYMALAALKGAEVAYPDFCQAILDLRKGDLVSGWARYGARWCMANARPVPYSFPVWDGGPVAGAILVYGEQGLGDEIMFASCLPDLARQAASIVVECDRRLEPLFRRSFPFARVYGRTALQDAAWVQSNWGIVAQTPIGDLPRWFRKSTSDFPSQPAGYLRADSDRVTYWKGRLSALRGRLRVGLSWRGGSARTRGNLRTLSLDALRPLFGVKDVAWVSLQYTDCQAEVLDFNRRHDSQVLTHWQEAIDDYDETAALVTALDLVVSVPTSVVSLCSALGKPVWVMTPLSPGWMLQVTGETTPWYPTARLFRQQQAAVWDELVQRIAHSLDTVKK